MMVITEPAITQRHHHEKEELKTMTPLVPVALTRSMKPSDETRKDA